MPDIQKKIRAVRRLRGLTQAKVAERAHVHLKTYQRMEAGASPVTHALLETFAEIFHCTADDIVRFDLERGQFESKVVISPDIEQLKSEVFSLKAENDYLRTLLLQFLDDIPEPPSEGGGEKLRWQEI